MAAAAAVDAFAERQLLMGEASEPAYEELARRARRIFDDHSRLFVFWRSRTSAECHAVGPSTRCFCTHSYSSHAWYETASKRIRCRVEGCGCECFAYVPGRGSSHLRCACKHTHHEHRTAGGRAGPCRACAPGGCAGFHSDWRCGCGETYDAHRTVFETAAERAKDGRGSASNLGGWGRERPHLDAACGGLTGMTSLAPDAALFRRFDAQAEALAARRAAMRGGVPPRSAPPPPRAARGPSLAQRRGVLAAAAERRAGEAAPLLLCGDDGRGAEGPPACSRTSRAQGFGPPAAPPPRAGSSRARAAVGSGGCRLPSSCLPPQPASSRRAAVATPCGPNGKGLHVTTQTSRRELAARAAEMRLMQAARQITS